MKNDNRIIKSTKDIINLIVISSLAFLVIVTGVVFAMSVYNGDIEGQGLIGILVGVFGIPSMIYGALFKVKSSKEKEDKE